MENNYFARDFEDMVKRVREIANGGIKLSPSLSLPEIKKPEIPTLDSILAKNPITQQPVTSIFEELRWTKVIKHPSVIVIIGNRGSGKSVLGYKLLEYMKWKGKVYVVGLPEKARKILPEWIGSVPSLEDVPPGSIALVDEAYTAFHSRSSASQHAKEISNLINLSRQREQTLIFISQEARQIDKNIASSANVIVIKNPGILQIEFERPQFRKILAEAQRMFAGINKDKNKWAYVYAPESDFTGMMESSLPTFWTPFLSKAYSDAKPGIEIKTPRKMTREDKIRKARELYAQRFSLSEVAKILGISKSTVKNYLDAYPYRKNRKTN